MDTALRDELFQVLAAKGAKLMGVGDLSGIVDGELTTGVSVAVPLPTHVVQDLQTAPTEEYYHLYHSLNAQLNKIVEAGAALLRERGYRAQANTTTAVQMDGNWRTPLPHKTVATRAGLGWIGKSCLLVTEAYGGAIRLSSLLTDTPLPAGTPIEESRCGSCEICVKSCPAHALTGALWQAGMPRETLFHREICKKTQLERMKQATGMDADLCGLCFAVCPYTKRYLL